MSDQTPAATADQPQSQPRTPPAPAPSSSATAPAGASSRADQAGARAPAVPLPAPVSHTTRHETVIDGTTWVYEATVATAPIATKKVDPAAEVFSASFVALPDGKHPDPTRPVTFAFNGGPGSSTTFLLLGSIGPRRIAVPEAAPVPPAPYRLIDNPESLLPATDLVFIDAPGTGFSSIAEEAKAELWSVDGDVAGFVAFIRHYLTEHRRWNSPKFILGESYGTTRGAALSAALLDAGVALNGLVLLSAILDYAHTVATDDENFIGYFPTYAAIAWYHQRAGRGRPLAEHVAAAREFASLQLRGALAQGDALPADAAQAAAERYAELTGLTPAYILRSDLRVPDHRFRKELLRDERKIVGRYDGRVAGYDLDAASDDETFVVDDAYLGPAYSALANAYLRDELGWDGRDERHGFADFDWGSSEPGKGWVWKHRLPEHSRSGWGREVPYPLVLPDLASAIVRHPGLRVLVANGYYDQATPFHQTEYDLRHLGLPAQLHGNVQRSYYEAGHMVYTSGPALRKFAADLRRFYSGETVEG